MSFGFLSICQLMGAFSLQTHVVWLPSSCQLLGAFSLQTPVVWLPLNLSAYGGLQPSDTCRLASSQSVGLWGLQAFRHLSFGFLSICQLMGAFSLQTHVVWLPSICQLIRASDTCRLASSQSVSLWGPSAFRHMSFGFPQSVRFWGPSAFRHLSFGFPQSVSLWGPSAFRRLSFGFPQFVSL